MNKFSTDAQAKLSTEQLAMANRATTPEPMTLGETAAMLASRGYHVFPLRDRDKTPRDMGSYKNATTNPEQIRAWWDQHPNANIGIACGASGIVVVDLDIHNVKANGVRGFARRSRGKDLPEPFVVTTGSGGAHLYYQASEASARLKSDANAKDGIDIRTTGGYVVAPGSETDKSHYWLWDEDMEGSVPVTVMPPVAELAEVTPALAETVRPTKPQTNTTEKRHEHASGGLPLGPEGQIAALFREMHELANTATGGRNDHLNSSAMKLAQIAAAEDSAFSEDLARGMLEEACRANGLITDDGYDAFLKTLRSGWEAGSGQPRELAKADEYQDLLFEREVRDRLRILRANREAQRILEQEQQTETGQAVDAGEFIFDLPDARGGVWGTGDHVLWAEGEALMIVGPPGVGKTTLTGQIVRARIGLGDGRVLGYPIKPSKSKVLYLAMDRPQQIARSLARHFDVSERDLVAQRLAIHQGPPPADVAAKPETLLWMAQGHGADTVIVDSLKDAAVGLSKDEVGAAYNRARQLLISNGIEVLELHHQKKNGNGEGSKPNDLSAVYGSTWLTSGAGSVVLLWGQAGDIEVELVHLKQPIGLVGPLRVHHDHANGHSHLVHDSDPLAILVGAGDGLSPRELAEAMGRGTDRAEIERSRRDLDRLEQGGLAESFEGTRAKQKARLFRATDGGRMAATKTAGMAL